MRGPREGAIGRPEPHEEAIGRLEPREVTLLWGARWWAAYPGLRQAPRLGPRADGSWYPGFHNPDRYNEAYV